MSMRFHEIHPVNEAVPGTDPATGKPQGTKPTPSVWDKISGIFKGTPAGSNQGRVDPLKSMQVTQAYKGRLHNGVDLRAAVGTALYAPEAGQVKHMKGLRAGLYIELTTASGQHKFMHLSGYLVQDGAQVRAGDQIARTGNTGISTGPHLHWEYWVNGQSTNPLP